MSQNVSDYANYGTKYKDKDIVYLNVKTEVTVDISKTDLKAGVRKLNQKMLSTKNAREHAKIRKEIKFFKKIGGV